MNRTNECEKLDSIYQTLNLKFDELYEKFKLSHILRTQKKCKLSYEDMKRNINKYKTVNYLYFYDIYCKLIETENGVCKTLSNSERLMETVLITQHGYRWIKIIGGNITRIENSMDEDFYGNYSIIDIVKKFKDYASKSNYLPNSQMPELMVIFYDAPSDDTIVEIEKLNVMVKTVNDIPLTQLDLSTNIKNANLDVSTLITLCSELTNIDPSTICDEQISGRVLNKIGCSGFDTMKSVVSYKKELLDKILKHNVIYVCKSAWETFDFLVNRNGGDNEKMRINDIKKFVTIIPDSPVDRISNCPNIHNDLYKNIFGTGEKMNSITYTGNVSFINNIESSGISVLVSLHKSFQLGEKVMLK